jgi:predicted nuclease of predicted toxin-antitoxin system
VKFVADEGLDAQIVEQLRQVGYHVWYIAEMEPGISDDTVLNLANQENAILLTVDKDFGELVFRLKRITTGVVLIRLSGLSTTRKAEIVSQVISQRIEDLFSAFTVITASSVRIRKVEN